MAAVLIHEFDPISALSLEEVNVLWSSRLAGTYVDPTGNTTGQPLMVPQVAFPVSSGDPRNPSLPSAWFNGTWLTVGNPLATGNIAQFIVGPGGGVVTLTSGLTYDVWSRLGSGGGAEAPVKFVGPMRVY